MTIFLIWLGVVILILLFLRGATRNPTPPPSTMKEEK